VFARISQLEREGKVPQGSAAQFLADGSVPPGVDAPMSRQARVHTYYAAKAKMTAGLPSLQGSSAGPAAHAGIESRPRPVDIGKMASPEEMEAAISYERSKGTGSDREKAGKVGQHLTERPNYYVELGRMMDPDQVPELRRALSPGDLLKAEGGWEKGPRGGTRKKVGSKWVYRGAGGAGAGGGGSKAGPGQDKGGDGPDKPEADKPGKPGADEEAAEVSGLTGEPVPGHPDSEIGHPDSPHDSHQTTQGKALHEVIDHLHDVDPKDLRARGEAVAAAVAKKDPEAGKRIKTAVHHLADAAQKGKALREKGKPSLKEDMTAAGALRSILRDFNAAAAPASILGPELGGVLKEDKTAGSHGDGDHYQSAMKDHQEKAQAALAEAQAANPDEEAADAAKGKTPPPGGKQAPPSGKQPPPDKVKKSVSPAELLELRKGPYSSGPTGGSMPRDETPSIPDFQELYYQPKTAESVKLAEEHDRTRRLATASRNRGVYGFHGGALPKLEPVLLYVPDIDGAADHTGPKLSARKPKVRAESTESRRQAGSPDGPEKDGSDLERKTDRGRVSRGPDRRLDIVPTEGGRPTPRDKATDEQTIRKMVGKIGRAIGLPMSSQELVVAKMLAQKSFMLEDDDPLEPLIKAAATGGKYIKRVPYFKDGKRKYRYYYAESSIAREAKAGEEVRLGEHTLTVESVDLDGSVTIKMGGRSRKLSREQYAQLLARHFGENYYKHAEKRAKQAMNAVFRHVSMADMAELKGDTFEERMADLKTRLPRVHAKLEASFQRAGIGANAAKRVIESTLERRGWSPEARAAAIGSVILHKTNVRTFYEVLRGAENLAAGTTVEAKHVGALVELRGGGEGESTSFADQVAKVATQAEAELAKLSELLASAKGGDDGAQAAALAAALTSTAIAKLNMLTQAFPGLKDKAAEESREVVLEVPSVIPGPPKTQGAETIVFVAGENGEPTALKARYELREAGDVVASHDPTKGFRQRHDYPEGVQERAYHTDPAEKMKVMKNAMRLRGEFIVNTNPDAVNGPPMITKAGHALGGNSRAMSVQLAYHEHPEVAAKMRQYLEEHAHEVGFTPDDVQAMKRPILVRVIDDPASEGDSLFGGGGTRKHSKDEMRLLVRQMNESFTQAMDPRTMQVAMGRKLTDATIESLASGMQEGETLAQFLTSSRASGFVGELGKAGIIDARNRNQYMDQKTKRLNADGRTLVSRILTGRLVGDADVLSATQPRTVDAVARTVPHLVAATRNGAGFDIGEDMASALRDLNELRRRQADGSISGIDSDLKPDQFERMFGQLDLFGGEADVDTPKLEAESNERSKLLLWTLIKKPGGQQLATVFKDYAKTAALHPEGQAGLDLGEGTALSPVEVLRDVVDRATGRAKAAPAEPTEDEKPATPEGPGLFG
jgi:endonuclease V-like protein UPF0215 family